MIIEAAQNKYDHTCLDCSSQGYQPQNEISYKDVPYYVIKLGTEHSSKTVIKLCETCLRRLITGYERISK